MKKTDAITHFGDASALARLLAITPHSIYQWPEKIPAKQQWPIALLSGFALMPDDDLMPKGVSVSAFKKGAYIHDEQVAQLLNIANSLAQQGNKQVIDALLTMAKHNQ